MQRTQYALTVLLCSILAACGGGGSDTQTAAPVQQAPVQQAPAVQPLHVYATSYENKNSIPFSATAGAMNSFRKVEATEHAMNERTVSYADFFQNGTYSAFAVSTNLTGEVADKQGYIYFFKRNAQGAWEDHSAQLMPNSEARKVCISPSFTEVADFNKDGKPDVFIACAGHDYEMPTRTAATTQEELNIWSQDTQRVVLSQPNGTYKVVEIPGIAYGHKASAADINADGNVDVVVSADPPYMLMGNGDGTFYRDNSIIGNTPRGYTDYGVTLIPIDGRIDIIRGNDNITTWTKGMRGGFDWSTTKVFPTQYSTRTAAKYQMPLDVIYSNGSFYFNTVVFGVSNSDEWAVFKYSADTLQAQQIYSFINNYDTTFKSYSSQLKLDNGYLVAYTAGCWDTIQGMCAMRVPG
jgi:uncharacterized protein involved in high-affinity Fe2+ transport